MRGGTSRPPWILAAAALAALAASAGLAPVREAAAALLPPRAAASGAAASAGPRRSLSPFSRPRVGLQAGHWLMADLPGELAHLTANTGTAAAGIAEVDLNRKIAGLVAEELAKAGVLVDILPASVPEGYDADAFIAIHADGGDHGARGWKIASPWRPSAASEELRGALAAAYAAPADIPEDRLGVTMQMRGYYAFGWNRYRHAVAPTTPSAIVETGFLTSPEDRRVLVGNPASVARRLAQGILLFLGGRAARTASAYVPRTWPDMAVTAAGAALRAYPGDAAPVWAVVPPGTVLRPLDERDGWFQFMVRNGSRVMGWMNTADLSRADRG